MKITVILLFIIANSFPLYSLAWGEEGHRVCGEIASRHLTKKASLTIAAILDNESIAMASNWADFIRSDTAYKYLDERHFIDLKDSLRYDEIQSYLKEDTTADAYTEINSLIAQLKNKQLPHDKQLIDLKLLIHFVEDIHQPLHTVGAAKGGNDIKVIWFSDASNLHRVWDSDLIHFQELSYTEYANALDHATKQQIKDWQSEPISKWLYDSYSIAQNLVSEIKQPNQKLSYRYNYDHLATLNEQLLKGGIDLAQVLNDIFG